MPEFMQSCHHHHHHHHHRWLTAIAAITREGGLGRMGGLPWTPTRLHGDMAFLQLLTTSSEHRVDPSTATIDLSLSEEDTVKSKRNAVIMGRKTWQSLPPRVRPLPGRLNIVVSGTMRDTTDVLCVGTVEEAIKLAETTTDPSSSSAIFILGGRGLYEEVLSSTMDNHVEVFLTQLVEQPETVNADVYFPMELLEGWKKVNITESVVSTLMVQRRVEMEKGDGVRLDGLGANAMVREGAFAYRFLYFYR